MDISGISCAASIMRRTAFSGQKRLKRHNMAFHPIGSASSFPPARAGSYIDVRESLVNANAAAVP